MKLFTLIVLCVLAISLNALRVENDHEKRGRGRVLNLISRQKLILEYLCQVLDHPEHVPQKYQELCQSSATNPNWDYKN